MVAKKSVIIGAGIAGLCAAVYARKFGYPGTVRCWPVVGVYQTYSG